MLTAEPRITNEAGPPTDYLGSLLSELWPAPARISRGRRVTRPANSLRRSYVVVPSLSRPKLVLPRRPARATANALRNYNAFLTGPARTKVAVMASVARLGLAKLWPHQVHVDVPLGSEFDGIDDYLGGALGRKVLTCLYVGPTRAVQKPVLQVLTDAGDTLAFAKVGVNPLTETLVRTEATNLEVLRAAPQSTFAVPEVLHTGRWRDHEVLVTRAFTGAGSGPVPPAALAAAGVELSQVGGVEHVHLAQSSYWKRLSTRLADLPTGELSSALRSTAAAVQTVAGSTSLAFGSWHGDWAPWNMTMSADRILVWDLEQFEHGVPLGFDAIHHAVQASVVFDRESPWRAFERVEQNIDSLLSPYGVDAAAMPIVGLLYLIEIATRYLHDGEVRSGGTTLGRLDTWLLPVLTQYARAVTDDPRR